MPHSKSEEVNFDGLIGPTHHFAGLSFGNIASTSNQGQISNPKKAALQGLKKMKVLHDAGLKQGVLPPAGRPDFAILKNLGFTGTPEAMLSELSTQTPELISAFYSASSMWAANSATVSPSSDTPDHKVHLTPANLVSKLHRSFEVPGIQKILKAVFHSERHFKIHAPLFPHPSLGDEGAANATRFCEEYGTPGVQLLVYGKSAFQKDLPSPQKFPARQTLEASQSVARLHGLSPDQVVFALQNPKAIDAGAFHNDVVAVGNKNFLFYHEEAFFNEKEILQDLKTKFAPLSQSSLSWLRVSSQEVTLKDAVQSYLFNSQLLSLPNQQTLLLAPQECAENPAVSQYLKAIQGSSSGIHQVHYVDLRESMQNGGGPACLRLRVVLKEEELQAVNPGVLFNEALFVTLEQWIEKYYRDHLKTEDLCDPRFNTEVQEALEELTQILKLGSIYSFQTR